METHQNQNISVAGEYHWVKTLVLAAVVAVVISALATAGAAWWSSRLVNVDSGKTFNAPAEQPISDGSGNAETPAAQPQEEMQQTTNPDPALQKTVNAFVKDLPTDAAVYVQHINSGTYAQRNARQQLHAGSLYKLFVAHEIYRELETGIITQYQSAGSGSNSTIEQCLRAMITVSDNTCGVALGNIISWEGRDSELDRLGYTDTTLRNDAPKTTAADVSQLLQDVYNGKYLSPGNQEEFLTLLRNQQINDRLPQGLPEDTPIAHKTSDYNGYAHDGGIVYGPSGAYTIVMLSGQWSDPLDDVYSHFANLSQKVYNHFN